ncbi:MAG: hypothetical protein GEU89_15260 [Kiloniellaceae bacterium]|nr:hypothetical protein [Kiloniellaceae bacterium]
MTGKVGDLRSRFDDDGYIIVDSEVFRISTRDLSVQLADFVRACNFACIDRDLDQRYLSDFISEIARREESNAITSPLYQLLPTVPAVYAFATQDDLLRILAGIGVAQPTLGTSPLIRIDRPREKKYQTPWHQDIWYSFSSEASVVIWMPLGEVTAAQGHLVVLPDSHRNGTLPFKVYEEGHEPYTPREAPDESRRQTVPVKFGEIIIFKQTLLHKSGDNLSDRCRVSMQLRYNEMKDQKQPFATFVAKYSDHVVEQQKRYLATND